VLVVTDGPGMEFHWVLEAEAYFQLLSAHVRLVSKSRAQHTR